MTQSQNNNRNPEIKQSGVSGEASVAPQEDIVLEEVRHSRSKKELSSVSASGKIRYKKSKKKKKHKVLKRVLLGILIFLIVVAVGAFTAYEITKSKGKKELLEGNKNATIDTIDDADSDDDGQTVTYKGEKYKFNENVISIVFLGIDKSDLGTKTKTGSYGQADAVYIFTYDTTSEKCYMIPVSRETMTEVQLYSASGQKMGLETMQLCLAHGYGDGKRISCENTLASLSRIFYNIPFTNYVSLDWDGIGPLNDAIGGVKLKAISDVSTDRSTIHKGETITLMGDDAWSYVKYRDTTKLKSNPDRLKRQKQYMNKYISKLIPAAKKDFTVISDLVDIADEYMYSNLTTNKLVYIASEILPNVYSSKDIEFLSIKGETKQGEEHAEFYPDETSLYETILKVFYKK